MSCALKEFVCDWRERRVEKCPVVFSGTWLYGNRLHRRRVSSRVVIFVLYEFCTTLFVVICRVACLPFPKHVHRRFRSFAMLTRAWLATVDCYLCTGYSLLTEVVLLRIQFTHLLALWSDAGMCWESLRCISTCFVIIVIIVIMDLCSAGYDKKNIGAKNIQISIMKNALGETQTLRAGCTKAEAKKFRPAADPSPGARDGQNLNYSNYSIIHSSAD